MSPLQLSLYYMQFQKFYIPLTKGLWKFRGERGGPKQCNFHVGQGALRLVSYQKLTAALSSKLSVNLLLTVV